MKTSGFKGHHLTLKKIQCCQYPLFLFFPVKLKQQWAKVVINMQNNVALNVFKSLHKYELYLFSGSTDESTDV